MIRVSDHRMCLARDGKYVVVAPCDPEGDDLAQLWQSTLEGEIHPQNDMTLCWVVGADPGVEHGGGGDHLNKTLELDTCKDHETIYTRFHMGRGFVGTPPKP
jgi:hypothetical protein